MGEVLALKCSCGRDLEMTMKKATYLPEGVIAGTSGLVECPDCETTHINIRYLQSAPLDFILLTYVV